MTPYEHCRQDIGAATSTWLVTGVAGFIGSNLLEALLLLNQRVTGIDNFASGHRKNLDEVRALVSPEQWQRFEFIEGDIRNLGDCQRACNGADYALHHAAIGSVARSIEDPIETNSVNIDGFVNLMLASREARVRRFVYASSSAIYGDAATLPMVEGVIGQPLSPYAVTKHVNELYASVFARCYGMEAVGFRYFNVFGPRQDPEGTYAAVVPQWAAAMLKGETVYINGDGETTRDFCHVADVVQANLLACAVKEAGALNQVYNIAAGSHMSLNELFALIRDRLGAHGVRPDVAPRYRDFREGDVRHSQADIGKAVRLLGFAPQASLEERMVSALEWYARQEWAKSSDCSRSTSAAG